MKRLLSLALLVATTSMSFAGTYFFNNTLTTSSPTTHITGQSTALPGIQYYHVLQFSVDTTGAYTIESASPNTAPTGSNALDTWLALFTGSFNPVTPGTPTTSNDDFTGAFTVLPGPYAGTVGLAGTGFTGLQPASRLASVALTAGTQYFLVNSSFRETTYVATGTNGMSTGAFYTGIGGPGNISPVPEPASMAALGIGALALLRRRKKA